MARQVLERDQFEATEIRLKRRVGPITPVQQERLGELQAKINTYWGEQTRRAKAQPDFLPTLAKSARNAPVLSRAKGRTGVVHSQRAAEPVIQRDETAPAPAPDFQLTPPSLLAPPTDASSRPLVGGNLRFQLKPQKAATLQGISQQISPDALLPSLSQVSLGALSLTPPPGFQAGSAGAAVPPAAVPTVAGVPSPYAPAAPAVPAGSGPATPREASAGDVAGAIFAVPSVAAAVSQLQEQAKTIVVRDWHRIKGGEAAGVVSSVGVVAGSAIAGIIASPEARQWVFSQLNGKVIPVPRVPWLRVEMNTGGDALMLGLHVDVGALLPTVLGFGPGASSAIGGPPKPQGNLSPVQRSAADPSEAAPSFEPSADVE